MNSSDNNKSLSIPGLFIVYILVSSLGILGYRSIFPGEAPPLANFSVVWRFVQGGKTLIDLFPALALAALVIPFGLRSSSLEKINSFSPKFIKSFSPSIIGAIVAAGIYALLLLLVLPLIMNYEANLRAQARFWKLSAEQAQTLAYQEDWSGTARFVNICEKIWPLSPELEKIRAESSLQLQMRAVTREPLTPRTPQVWNESARQNPPTATEAIQLAEAAFTEKRYYDAHWLATLGANLADQRSAQYAMAIRIASDAWNAVSDLLFDSNDEAYETFRIKNRAYSALISNDPTQAYYLFMELYSRDPSDPEVLYYLTMSEQELSRMAFFIDEMDLVENPEGAIFSLPLTSMGNPNPGRMVMRFTSLSVFPDYGFGFEFETLAFDQEGKLLWRMEAPYVKALPISQEAGDHVLILTRALDRMDTNRRWEPITQSFGAHAPMDVQLTIDLIWENFMLLAGLRRGQDKLNIGELNTASRIAADYGYLPQIYEAELLSRITEPILFLPLIIFFLIVGWRFRTVKRPRLVWVLMLGVLPLVFSGIIHLFRIVLDNISTLAVVYLGYSPAFFVFAVAALLLFFLSLVILAFQHS
jgi:hypothetical protein